MIFEMYDNFENNPYTYNENPNQVNENVRLDQTSLNLAGK